MPRFGFFKKKKNDNSPSEKFKTFILEPILTPSGLVDGPDEAPDLIADNPLDLPDVEDRDLLPELDDSPLPDLNGDLEEIPFATSFDSGAFTVGETGEVEIDFLYDGGAYEGQLAIFSLEGMEEFEPGSEAFVREAARRALSDSEWGHVVIDDAVEGARFEGGLAEGNFNRGDYQGVSTASMRPGDTFGFMLVPDGTVEQVYENPGAEGSVRPLFSLSTANPDDGFHVGQIADVTGEGNTFAMEDARMDGWTDRDYNDVVFQVRGATGEAVDADEVINPWMDWRSTEMGEELIENSQQLPDDSQLPTPDSLIEEGDSETGGWGEELIDSSVPEDSLSQQDSPDSQLPTPDSLVREQLAQFVAQPDFAERVALAFGEGADPEQAATLVESLIEQLPAVNGDGSSSPLSPELPTIEIVSGTELGSRGAFAAETNTIYLSQEFLSQSVENPEVVAEVLLEELVVL